MTSPYDILKTSGNFINYQDSKAEPMWLSYFDTKYQYYHCMETKWSIEFNFGVPFETSTPANKMTNYKDLSYYVFWRYTAYDEPPTAYKYNTETNANSTGISAPGIVTNDQYYEPVTMSFTKAAPSSSQIHTSSNYE